MGGVGSSMFLTNRESPHIRLGGITTKHQLTLDTTPTFHTALSDKDIKPVTSRQTTGKGRYATDTPIRPLTRYFQQRDQDI